MRRVRGWCGIGWRLLWWVPGFIAVLLVVLFARIGWGRREARRIVRALWQEP